MTVHLRTTETGESITLYWESNRLGEVVANHAGVSSTHPTILTEGKVSLQIGDQPPQEFEAPRTIILPINTPYSFTSLTSRTTVHCIYNKRSGAADEIRHLVTDDKRRVFMD